MIIQPKQLNILFLEDNETDVELMVRLLRREGFDFIYNHVLDLPSFTEQLITQKPTIIISDYNLPSATALDGLYEAKRCGIKVPFIVVSAYLGDKKAVDTLKAGVTDIVSKSNLEQLPFAIARALEEMEIRRAKEMAEQELKLSKERLELAIYGGDLGTWDLDVSNYEVTYNERARKILRIAHLPQHTHFKYFLPIEGDQNRQYEDIKKNLERCLGGSYNLFEYELFFSNNGPNATWVVITGKVITRDNEGNPLRMSGTIRDITNKKKNENEILRNKTILEEAEKMGVLGSFDWDLKHDKFFSSEGFKTILPFDSEDPDHVDYFSNIHPSDRRIFEEVLRKKNGYYSLEHRIITQDGIIKPIRSSGKIIYDSDGKIQKILGLIQDITEQRALKSAIFKGQDKERQRIAREIHDGVGQMLVAAKYRLMSINEENYQPAALKDIEDLIDLILEESRRIAKNLTAKIVEEHGLTKAVKFLLEDINAATELNVFGVIEPVLGLTLEMSNSMYRIIQEAINNVVKYADASQMNVSMHRENEYLKIEVMDDGKGFDYAKLSENGGHGLKNMKERALLYNGLLEIISCPGAGTTIKCIVPINENL